MPVTPDLIPEIITRYFEYTVTTENSNKFYQLDLQDNYVFITYGRRGTLGIKNTKIFDTAAEATVFINKKAKEKLAKGYKEVNVARPLLAVPLLAMQTAAPQKMSGKDGPLKGPIPSQLSGVKARRRVVI